MQQKTELTEREKIRKTSMQSMIFSIVAMICCISLGIVSIHAALTQTLTVNDKLTITTAGHAIVAVDVYGVLGPADGMLLANNFSGTDAVRGLTYGAALVSKSAATQNASGSGLNPVFSIDNQYTYAAYKIVLSNTNVSASSYTIAITGLATPTDMVEWLYVKNAGANFSAVLADAVTGSLPANTGTDTVYLVLRVKVALDELTAFDSDPFSIVITVTTP